MSKTVSLACLLLALACSGCTVSDMVFGVFNDHYTEGGDTYFEKHNHYQQQLESFREQEAWEDGSEAASY